MNIALGDEVYIGSSGPFHVVHIDNENRTVRLCTSLEWNGWKWARARDRGKDYSFNEIRAVPVAPITERGA
jgi:hypothetical protein